MSKLDDDLRSIGLSANNDQFDESLRRFAKSAGLYYEALLGARIPHDLAANMVSDWHQMYWEAVMRPRTES